MTENIASYNNSNELLNQRSRILNICWLRKAYLFSKRNMAAFFSIDICKIFIFSRGHFFNKMSFGPTFFRIILMIR